MHCNKFLTFNATGFKTLPGTCNSSIGLEDGTFVKSSFNSSSVREIDRTYVARYARLSTSSSFWKARFTIADQWIQVRLTAVHRITAVATEGNYDQMEWVSSYRINFTKNGITLYTHQDPKSNVSMVRLVYI